MTTSPLVGGGHGTSINGEVHLARKPRYLARRFNPPTNTKNHPLTLANQGVGFNGWRTDLVSHKATLQYLLRWSVSRPGTGWNGVGPLHFMHAIARTAVCPITSTKSIPRLPYFTDSEHNASFEHGSLERYI